MEVFDVQTGKRRCSRQREQCVQRAGGHGLLKEVEEQCVVCVVCGVQGGRRWWQLMKELEGQVKDDGVLMRVCVWEGEVMLSF